MSGEFAEDFTSLKWQFRETRDAEIATFSVGGIKAVVIDYDGDRSGWEIRVGRSVLACGEDCGGNPPHFFVCLRDAETALRAEVANRIAAVKRRSLCAYGGA